MNILLVIYRKMQHWKNKLEIQTKEWEIRQNQNITLGTDVKIFPETQMLTVDNGIISIDKYSVIRGECCCIRGCGKIIIGSECYIGENSHIWSSNSIIIGNRVLIAHNCNIFDDATHPLDSVERNDDFYNICFKGTWNRYDSCKSKPIVIEEDAWVGANVVILPGVRIGKGAIVGAGSVVTHNIPDYALAHGNPAKVYRYLKA